MKSLCKILAVLIISSALPAESTAQWVQTNGPSGGPVITLAVGGSNLFAGTPGGGVFLSTNSGTEWTNVSIGLANTEVLALATSGQNVFAGTYGNGVFLSPDNGKSWTAVNHGLTNTEVRALAVSGENLFAGLQSGGVFLSTNSGADWSVKKTGLPSRPVITFAFSGQDIYAGTQGGGMYLSTNSGNNWTPAGLEVAGVYAIAILGPSLFAGVDSGVFVSTDKGKTWSPTGPSDQYVSALAVIGGDLYVGTSIGLTRGVFLSTNGGKSWTDVSAGLTSNYVSSLAAIGTNLFAGTGTGVWRYTATNTPAGRSVSVQPVDASTGTSPVTITFDTVKSNGNTTLSMTDSGPTPPGGFQMGDPPVYYDIKTTAQFSGPISVCVKYSESSFQIPDNMVLLHFEGGQWVDTKATVDTASRTICGTVTSLSPFAIFEPSTVSVKIDIIPGLSPNLVIPNTVLPIPVGIFSSKSFDATQIVISSVRFGRTGAKVLLGKGIRLDLNGDRKSDLLLAFNTKQAGIQPGDTSAKLTGKTVSGQWFVGTDRVKTTRLCLGKESASPEETIDVPSTYSLGQNYPNPFNPTTTIKFELPRTTHVNLSVYDMLGRKLIVLVNEMRNAGAHEVKFDGANLASGVYFYRLQAEGVTLTKKLILVR